MALLTRDTLLTMDVAFDGQPFVRVAAKDGLTSTDTLDVAWRGQPFWVVEAEAAPDQNISVNVIAGAIPLLPRVEQTAAPGDVSPLELLRRGLRRYVDV